MTRQDGAGWMAPESARPQDASAPLLRPGDALSPWDAPLGSSPVPGPAHSRWPGQDTPSPSGRPAPGQPVWSDAGWAFPPPPPPASTNAWSVVALVAGLFAVVPVAVPAGIVGLVQIGRRPQPGRWLAVGGLVASGLWTVVIAAVITVLAVSWDTRLGRVADAGPAAVGDCLSAPDGGSPTWTASDCTGPHDGEVYLVHDLGEGPWPGEDAIATRADDACYESFSGYVGRSYVASAYDYAWFGPDADEWAAGEQRAVCIVVPYDDDVLHEPVRGSGD